MAQDLLSAIRAQALPGSLPDGSKVDILTVDQVDRLAHDFSLELRQVEISSLENQVIPQRYLRNLKTYTPGDQACLLKAKVAVIGLGGLGGSVTELLARLGIGRMALVDGDCFEDHNLNRQLFATNLNLGKSKVREAIERVKKINPAVETEGYARFFKAEDAAEILDDVQVVVDCLDTIDARFLVQEAAQKKQLPLVSAAVAGLSGHVTTILPQDRGLSLIYGDPTSLQTNKGAEKSLGCLAPAVSLLACLEASEVCKVILKKDGILSNQLLLVDLNDYIFDVLDLL